MFDVRDLPVLTFGNCVFIKTGVIKWYLKLHVMLLRFFTFFSKFKKRDFTF